MRFLRFVVIVAVVSSASRLSAEPSHRLRNPDQLVLEGLDAFDHDDLRAVLQTNFDLIVASRPNTPLAEYLTALEKVVAIGLAHSGCESARVAAAYDRDRGKIVVRVQNGSRHFCHEVQITGAGDELARAIASPLTTSEEPDRILWRKGYAVPYDEPTRDEMQRRIAAVLADAGYFAARWNVATKAEPDAKSATLVVAINHLGPRAEIGAITVLGCERDDDAQVLRHLELQPGQPFDGHLPVRITERLQSTGRYLASEVSHARNDQQSGPSREVRDLTIRVREFKFAPSLAEPLSAEEQALLRLSDWASRWQMNETPEDLVVSFQYNAVPPDSAADTANGEFKRWNLKLVAAPRRGTIMTVQGVAAGDATIVDIVLASLPDRLLLGSPLRKAKLELPHGGTGRLKVTGETKGLEAGAAEGRPFAFTFNVSWKTVEPVEASPLQIETKLHPASLLQLFNHESINCRIDKGRLEVRRPGVRALIDAASGRPIEIVWADPASGWTISIAAVSGAFAAERAAIDQRLAGASSALDAGAPWRSAVCFVLEDVAMASGALGRGTGGESSREQAAAYRALRKLVEVWKPPAAEHLAAAESRNEASDALRFTLPPHLTDFDLEDLFEASDPQRRRNLIGFLIGLLQKAGPQDGWLGPLGRDLLLAYSRSSLPAGSDLKELVQSPATGPLGESLLAMLGTIGAPQEGLNRLSPQGFQRDCQPLLAGDNLLSRLLLSLAEAARTLDENELRAVASLVGDESSRGLLTTLLVKFKAHDDRPTAEALALALDEVWKQRVGDWLRVVLESQLAAERSRLSLWQYPQTSAPKIVPIAPFQQPTPLDDQLKGLEALEEELRAASAKRPGKDDATPLSEALKSLEVPQKR